MPAALSLPQISTNVRFAASALLFPELAGAWAERMFLTPPTMGLTAAARALALATKRVRFEKVVLVTPPADLVGYSRRFARWHWMPEAIRHAMQSAIEERYGVLWDNLEVARLAPRLREPVLVIHDRDDRHVPWTQGAHIARLWPGARLMSTDGLGHGRILHDEAVTRAAADFVPGRSAVANIASDVQPAPLY